MSAVDNNNISEKVEMSKQNGDLEAKNRKNVYSEERTPVALILVIIIAVLALIAACAATWLLVNWQTSLIVFAGLTVIYFFLFTANWWYVAICTAPRDISGLYNYTKILRLTGGYNKKGYTIPDIFHENVLKHPDKACFLFEDEVWTYKQIEDLSMRISSVMKANQISKGQTIALLLNNCPQYAAIWMGVGRIGGIIPLINTNQTGRTLIHSITIAKCDGLIYGHEFEDAVMEVLPELSSNLKLFKFTHRPISKPGNGAKDAFEIAPNKVDLSAALDMTPVEPWYKSDTEGFTSKLLYIYTSGTTGLPKAAVISSSRMVFMASGVHFLAKITPKDIIYCPMPMYHSAGGCVSVGQALVFGCAVVLKTKFSASSYFADCIKYKATAAHYIGEMCRYILATPPSPTDKQHTVRCVYGNGMRPQIWGDFVKRFNIKRVCEFYGATEGNANIINNNNTQGAIGFVSRIVPALYPIAIIRVDEDTGEPIRNSKGLCILAKANEPGAFIGKIQPNNPSRAFMGYVNKEESEKKIVRNVFSKGDSAFISGDILVADKFGYLYFKDRTGDTYRWRGENVSTTEVEASVSRVADQRDAVVYGVEVPGIEGRAGMCGLVDKDGTLDLNDLAKKIAKDLPTYARPVFLRIMPELEMTGTFKMRKVDLQKEGFDPSKITDKLYYLDVKSCKYLTLGEEEFDKISTGKIRL